MQNIQLPDDQFQRLSEISLRENVAAMERGEAEIDAGGGQDMKEALVEIANKYKLNIPH